MIKKILKTYRGLPREVQMMVAMAGLASPIGVIYLLQRWVFPGWPLIAVIAVVAGGLLLLALIGWLISKLFGLGGAKRTKRMANDLAREDAPASVDVRAKIKANNEKFFNHIKEMKKTINVSVYDLPWYIVIGDSGCGKTKLVNNGGLQFSMGRPEGYQLGTLDYNWWFSDDAVFIDMAGRLCNPQEAQDHREWQAFLNTIAKGRKGFPINGTVLCISADHLLQDSPEKHEADANIALERLREMQSRLGVTFATYLVITKCDKILGFMQFFDRAVRDLKVKNQIFGWSKPGEFNELFDPESFHEDFESLYFRLNELRMRRLNDEGVDEIDRGLAYSFPEEFRELREPLQTYLRTVFAPIKHSGAIKNLIFRGIYFTSATQEGELILKHLSERLGSEAASQFPTLDSLYPEKRPLFVKDVLFQKMFPENGLVFRHEGDVVRNRKLARLLTISSIVLAVVLGTTLFFSSRALKEKLNDPRMDASQSTKPQHVAKFVSSPDDALVHVGKLSGDISSLEQGLGAAAIFLLAWDADEPVRDLRTIRARLFEDAVLRPALADVGTELESEIVWSQADGDLKQVDQAVGARIDALEEFVRWYGCRKRSSTPPELTHQSLTKMTGIVNEKGSIIHKESFDGEAGQYFAVVQDPEADWTKNPARFLDDATARKTIEEAIRRLHRYFRDRYAMLDDSASEILGEWMRVSRLCATIEENYRRIVSTNPSDITTPQQLEAFTSDFFSSHDRFKEAMGKVAGELNVEGMKSLEEALLDLRGRWTGFDERMDKAYETCGETDAASLLPSLANGDSGLSLVSLDQVFWTRMYELRMTNVDWEERYRAYFGDRTRFDQVVNEVHEVYDYLIDFTPGDEIRAIKPSVALTDSSKTVRAVLQGIRDSLPESASVKGTRNLEEWAVALQAALTATQASNDRAGIPKDLAEAWRPADLTALDGGFLKVNRLIVTQLQLTQLLRQLEGRSEWSLGELYADYGRMTQSAFSIPKPSGRPEAPEAEAKTEETVAPKEEQEEQRGVTLPSLFKDDEPATAAQPTKPSPTPEVESRLTSAIPQCASPEFMTRVAFQWVQLVYMLEAFRETDYLAMGDAGMPLHQQCTAELRRQWRRYAETYATSWRQAYEDKSLAGMAELQRPSDWESFAGQFATSNRGIKNWQDTRADLEASLKELLRATRWATYHQGQGGFWEDVGSRQIRPLVEELVREVGNALAQSGPRGSFVQTARADGVAGVPEAPPWDKLASAFGLGLSRLAGAIGECTNLEKQLDLSVSGSRLPEIPWGEIAALRESARLSDEVLISRLVDLESHGLELLNRKLTAMLHRVQEDSLGSFAASGGWPYVGSGSLATVDFQAFKKFLAQVRQFKTVFQKLDDGIARHRPNDPSLRSRIAFYAQCQQWYDFLGLKGGVNDLQSATPLEVIVQGDDPVGDSVFAGQVEDTAQHYYARAELEIGLRTGSGDTLELDTQKTEYSAKAATWDWDRQSGVTMQATLKHPTRPGYPEKLTAPIGQSSPLALCAYLQKHANGGGRNWRTLAKFRTDGIADAHGQFLGAMFVFQLNRAMPEPIEKLHSQ